jgi:leucyl aminopeptidase (aminopeptidase T)
MFGTIEMMKGARIAVETCLGVKPGEKVLVVTDYGRANIALALAEASEALGAETLLLTMKPRAYNAEEPPEPVAAAMKTADVVFIPTTKSLTHTTAREEATEAGARLASMPNITEDMMKHGGMTADYHQVAELCWKFTEFLQGAREAEITTPLGTQLRLGLEGREPGTPPDTGLYLKPGEWGNLPAGEAYIAPLETQTDGIAVVDGTIAQIGLPSQPVTLEFREGRVVRIEGGGEAIQLRNLLESLEDENAYVIAELGIGTNEAAGLTGITLEDEKILGTVHVAIGRNTGFGGVNMSKIHLDFIMTHPTLKIDGKTLIENGQLKI